MVTETQMNDTIFFVLPGYQFRDNLWVWRLNVENNNITKVLWTSNYRAIIGASFYVNFRLNNDNELLLLFNECISVTTETYKRRN